MSGERRDVFDPQGREFRTLWHGERGRALLRFLAQRHGLYTPGRPDTSPQALAFREGARSVVLDLYRLAGIDVSEQAGKGASNETDRQDTDHGAG